MKYNQWFAVAALAAGTTLAGVAQTQDPNAYQAPPSANQYGGNEAYEGGQAPYAGQQQYGAQQYGRQQYGRQQYGADQYGNPQSPDAYQAQQPVDRSQMRALRQQLREDIRAGRPRAAARDARQLAMARRAMRQQYGGPNGMRGDSGEGENPGGGY